MSKCKNTRLAVLWGISLTLFGIAFLSFYYIDLKSLTVWSTNIWDTLFTTGGLRQFYAYCAQNRYGLEHELAGNDILIRFPWAIWNLPIWAIQYFGHVAIVDSPVMLFYSKCYLLMEFVLICVLIRKILSFVVGEEEQKLLLYFYVSSPFLLYGIAYAGQNDVQIILIFLYGLYQCILGHKKRFLFLSALSIALKPYFIFSYVALVLLREKKIHDVILQLISGVSIMFLQKLLYIGAPMYAESLSYGPMKGSISKLFDSQFSIPPVGGSYFILSLCIVYLMAYFTDWSETESNHYELIYYTFLPFLCYFAFSDDTFYRPIYLVTFLVLCMGYKKKYFRMNLLLEILYTGCSLFYAVFRDPNFLAPKYLVWNRLGEAMPAISEKTEQLLGRNWYQLFLLSNTVCFVVIVMLAVVNHPKFQQDGKILTMETEGYLLYVRVLMGIIPMLLCILFSVIA